MNSKLDNWRSIFADWEVSGLSQREYCRVKGIVYSTFIYWRVRVKRQERPVPLSQSDEGAPLVRYSPPKPPLSGSRITVEWPDGMKVSIPSSGDSGDIARLVKQLREAC